MTVPQRIRVASDLGAVLADGADVVLDPLLAAGGAGEPAVGAGDPVQHRGYDVALVGRERGLDLGAPAHPQLGKARQERLDRHVLAVVVAALEADVAPGPW